LLRILGRHQLIERTSKAPVRVLEARAPLAAKRQAWRACLGGGYGDPLKRDPQIVADDIRHG